MRFVLDRTRQEAERKRIEAAGIADLSGNHQQGSDNRLWQAGIACYPECRESRCVERDAITAIRLKGGPAGAPAGHRVLMWRSGRFNLRGRYSPSDAALFE